MADRVLLDTYNKIRSDKPPERSNGLAELKQILSLNKNSKDLGDKGYHNMFEAIFEATLKEKALYTRLKKPSSIIRSRFSLCGSVFRLAVELGVKQIRAKTFKAVYSHIIDILPQNGGFCEPISLDYLRALRSCLEYAPHAEHLAPDDWEIIATFCCTNVESQLRIVTEEDGDVDMDPDSDEDMGDSVLSVRGTRPSLVRDSSSMSKGATSSTHTGVDHHSEQLLLCLQILLRTPNAPVAATNEMTCRTILGFLTSQPTVTRVHQDVFSALNSILEVTITNNITLSSKVAEAIVPVITKMWDSKSPKEQMMITLIYLQPHLRKLMRSLTGAPQKNFRTKLEALSDAIFTEYSTRAERDQLQLEDICFPDPSKDLDIETTPLALAAYCLRSDVPSRTEQHWIVPYLMAMLIEILDLNRNDDQGRSKRRKVSTKFDELLMNAKSMLYSRKICALQTLPFLIRESQRVVDLEGFSTLITDLLNVCSDDSPIISSWAMLSISSCAFLRFASDPGNTQIWNQTWHLCARYSANLSTCRAACHLMRILLALDLVSYPEISASVDATILSIDLSGPSNVIDSSLAVWCLILERRNTVAHSSLLQPGERLFQWFISKWRPVETLERVTAAFYAHHGNPKDICRFLFSCCGKSSLEFDSYSPRTYGLVGQAIIRVARCTKLLDFLLLEETLDSWSEAKLTGGPKLKAPKVSSGVGTVSHPGVELQVIEFLDRECEGIHERWKKLTQTGIQQPSSDMLQNYVGFVFTAGIMCSVIKPRDTTKVDALERKLETLTLYLASYITRDDFKELHLDGILRCMSGILPRPASIVDRSFITPEVFQGFFGNILCTISRAFEDKVRNSAIIEVTEGGNDMMDLDDGFGMQLRGFGDKKDGELSREEVQAMCSPETFRYSTAALLALFARSVQFETSPEICRSFADYLQQLPTPRLIMCRPLFRDFLTTANLKDDGADQLTQHVGGSILQDYETDRCETAVALCIDLLSAFVGRWAIDRAGGELATDCEQIYIWMARVALERSLFSHTIRTAMAQLLGRMLEVNSGYGLNSDSTSARSHFIKCLQDRDVRVTFFMANCTSVLFRIYGLASHPIVMDDVLKHLTDEIEWIEGLSMRVYTLSQLADTISSMNKLIVYHIFETGQLESMVKYAARSLSFVAKALKLGDHRSLFKIFSPQIIYTWIENADLAVFPFRVFGYQSHKDLFSDIQEDLVAQLLMRGKDNAAKELALMLGVTYDELLEKGFHKIVAYGAAWAVGVPPKEDGRYQSVDIRVREHMGANAYKKLLEKKFALIIACLFQIMQEDGTSEKFLAKDPNFSVARDLMKGITGISHSTAKLTDPLQPFFKVKVVLNSVHHICTRVGYDDSRLWSPAMFTFVVRRLFDTMDPALGSLHACAVVRKIRLLVCLAREQALRGYALEMVVHGLKPFIVDKYCTEDTIGVLQYLLDRGKDYLSRQPAFVTGTFLSILAPLRTFIPAPTSYRGKADGQLYASHSAARKFRSWLGDFFLKYEFTELSSRQNQMFQSIVEAAIEFKSGNASARTKESDLLRHLLDDDRSKNRLLDDVSRGLAFSLVCSDFQRPQSFRDDIFGEDQDSVERSRVLLRTCRRLDVNQGFLLWCARVLGRSYAASGEIYNEWTQEIELEKMIEFDNKRYDLDIVPKAGILHRLRSLLLGEDRIVIGTAEKTLETIFFEEAEANDITTFDFVFKEDFYSALKWTTLPTSLAQAEVPRPIITVGRPETLPVDVWIKDLAAAISTNLQQDAIVKNLRPILEKVEGLAKDLFPFVVHVLLLHNLGSEKLRVELSQLFRDCFKTCTEKTIPHTIILINTILYLRTQPMVDEDTQLPRDHWLDVNYLDMAHAACTCKMFKTSLLFAEIYHSEGNSEFSESDLLLEIFKNIDDLDSYYGVTQPPSLETAVSQFEYEEDGWKSLSFRGANLESQLRLGSSSNGQDIGGLVDAFNAIGMNGLSHYFLQSGVAPASTTDNMFRSAWKLEQWDLPCPSSCNTRSAIVYRTLQSVNNSVDTRAIPSHLDSSFLELMLQITTGKQTGHSLGANMRTLAMLTEMEEILVSKEADQLEKVWDRLQERESWMHIGRFSDVEEIMAMRQTIFSSLAKREHLRHVTHVDMKTARFLEAKALVDTCKMARSHKVLQHSLSAATQLSKAVSPCKEVGLKIDAVATLQAANVLWDQGRGVPPIKMLQTLGNSLNPQSIVIGRAKLLAKLGNWISEARLEKPDKIMSTYLGPAIQELEGNISGREAGRVFHEFASFCDQQLQNPGNIEDFQRALKLRQNKEAEVKELKKLLRKSPAGTSMSKKLERMTFSARLWLSLDDKELKKLQENRDAFLEKSIGNYLLCLAACDDYDNDAVRFCALWLEHSSDAKVNNAAKEPLTRVPSRKFVPLMNQLSSRLLDVQDNFQKLLFPLIARICKDHPHHGTYQILALGRSPKGPGSEKRDAAAVKLISKLRLEAGTKEIFGKLFNSTNAYICLAQHKLEKQLGKLPFRNLGRELTSKFMGVLPSLGVPPPTMQITIRADCNYTDLAVIEKFEPEFTMASGLSAPKIISCRASDGVRYKMLFKGGPDDLRQDAIMEQVFEQVSNLLKKNRTTRQRNLSIRTYKVVPLTHDTGIIEFVPNTIPLHDFLIPAHERYHPKDLKNAACRKLILDAQMKPRDTRVAVFQNIIKKFKPVMRYFFMHKFNGPDDWFTSRLAYSRSTAAASILGYVLGLGDRHGHNILLDEKSGEVVHIDLGVAFEQGRILPVPEVVPFRLTRDIIDGMGITKTEGVFRRCCEFTLTVLRNESYNITTILDVLRYDPLYSWTISPLRMKRMQEQEQEEEPQAERVSVEWVFNPVKEEGESEADRALTVVAKKLSKTLSVGATVNELIQQASDVGNLAVLFAGWAAYV
ncbi:hypothetical protein DFP73DRAFT_546051 [Morchella snyderi]|nr:hypothetical protein DFP73DRAFT_546051 [Morchella snyderi]